MAVRGHVEGFVPFVHVRDVRSSAAFYAHFGFEVHDRLRDRGRRVWCWLERNQARLMLAEADGPVDSGLRAVLFYLYAHDLKGLHRRLDQAGFKPGPIVPGAPGPDREFRVDDPDGYCVMVTDAAAMVPSA